MKYIVDNDANTTKYFKKAIDKYVDARDKRDALLNGDINEYSKASRKCDEQMAICFNVFEGAEVVFTDGKVITIRTLADVYNIGSKARH